MTTTTVQIADKIYTIDEYGNIFKKRGKGFKVAFVDEDGYLRFGTNNKETGKYHNEHVHRIVYRAWHGEIPEEMTVDHIDNNRRNNHKDNLQLITATENAVKGNAVWWMVTSPDGEEFQVYNIEKFCRDNDLHASHIKTHSYKGWKAKRNDDH